MAGWTAIEIPDLSGRTMVVTGSGGLGFETALELARSGAEVIVAGRNATKGAQALAAIRAQLPGANVQFEAVDLASLDSIKAFCTRLRAQRASIDVLINNAGVMAPPLRKATADGFELQLGTNHLGHFALTGQLLPLLRLGRAPRVVTVSSLAHRSGKIDFEDPQAQQGYRPMTAYGQSKLANLLFAQELQRRSDAAGWGLMSNAAHPGLSRTDLIENGSGANSASMRVYRFLSPLVFQSAASGALPTLYAATSPQAQGGAYYGPGGMAEFKGAPKLAKVSAAAKDQASAARLWALSERLTGVTFD